MLRIFFLVAASLLLPAIANASPIDLTCNDKKVYGFREDSPMAAKWAGDSFGSSWRIQYDGFSDQALIDGKPVMAIKGNNTAILIEYSANSTSQSLWTYAIHLGDKNVAASQVNVYDLMGAGLKARTVEFSCR